MDDPRTEAMMAEMEREISGIDDENPNPRQLASLMRKMSAITGEKVPQEMDEMIRRLESGEDPENIEQEMGDVLGDDPMPDGGPVESSAESNMKARLRRLRAQPRRDPVLYEISEFVK